MQSSQRFDGMSEHDVINSSRDNNGDLIHELIISANEITKKVTSLSFRQMLEHDMIGYSTKSIDEHINKLSTLLESTNDITKNIKSLTFTLTQLNIMLFNLGHHVNSYNQFNEIVFYNLFSDINLGKIIQDITNRFTYRYIFQEISSSILSNILTNFPKVIINNIVIPYLQDDLMILSITEHFNATMAIRYLSNKQSMFEKKAEIESDEKRIDEITPLNRMLEFKPNDFKEPEAEGPPYKKHDQTQHFIAVIQDDIKSLFKSFNTHYKKNEYNSLLRYDFLLFYIDFLLKDKEPTMMRNYLFCYCMQAISSHDGYQWRWRDKSYKIFVDLINRELQANPSYSFEYQQVKSEIFIRTALPLLLFMARKLGHDNIHSETTFSFRHLSHHEVLEKYFNFETPKEAKDSNQGEILEKVIKMEETYRQLIYTCIFPTSPDKINLKLAKTLFLQMTAIQYLKQELASGAELTTESVKKNITMIFGSTIFKKSHHFFKNEFEQFISSLHFLTPNLEKNKLMQRLKYL